MQKTLFLTHDFTDPEFNLASEEYLLKEREESFIYLWVNSPSVIVGVNQNTIGEVNLSFTEEKGIKVVRRLTGGGAVYHDENNLNYMVIAPYKEGEHDFKRFASPVIEYLRSLGLNAKFSGRNDIEIDGKKISGNAQTVYNGRVLHHGTLLFKTDINMLSNALKENKLKIESKGIKSVRSRVTNISECLGEKLTFSEFKNGLINEFKKDALIYDLTKKDIEKIEEIKREKYSTYEWNIGRSPIGKNRFDYKFSFGVFSMVFSTVNGKMEEVEIFGDFFSKKPIIEFSKELIGVRYEYSSVLEKMKKIGEYVVNADGEEITKKLFS